MKRAIVRNRIQIKKMFSSISERYDLLNHLLSMNLDRSWRKTVRDTLSEESRLVLDIGSGTADLGLEIVQPGRTIICSDFSHEMLLQAKKKVLRKNMEHSIKLIEADSLSLPFRDASIEAVVSAFTIRNFESMETGFSEMIRVLKPSGRSLILEFSKPANNFVKTIYLPYLKFFVPLVGTLLSGNRTAYRYLSSTIRSFPEQKEVAGMMERAGFEKVSYKNLSGGIVTLYIASKRFIETDSSILS